VGTSQQVAMRRDIIDIEEIVRHKVSTYSQEIETSIEYCKTMLSGSHKEGFRMKGSDLDFYGLV
jgi:hypothetical protein